MLADMAIGVETSRLITYLSALEVDQGKRNTYHASIAKAYASEVANKCAADAVQVRHQFDRLHFKYIRVYFVLWRLAL